MVGLPLLCTIQAHQATASQCLPQRPSRAVSRTSKITGCLRLQPTGFNTLNHDAKVLHLQGALSVSVTFCHFLSLIGAIW